MTNTFRSAALAAVLSLAAATPAFAQTNSNLAVSATVTNNCVVSTSPMVFAGVDVTSNAHLDSTAELSVRCTKDAAWTATAGVGSGTGASLSERRMMNGETNLLGYNLYTDLAKTTVWGGAGPGTISATGSGAEQLRTIYGRVFGGQGSLPAGTYQDTVQIVVSY
jgi:spore coat protein U-like protein